MPRPPDPSLLRKLPPVDEILRRPSIVTLVTQQGHPAVTDAVRFVLARLRTNVADSSVDAAGLDQALGGLDAAIERQLASSLQYSLRPVINATGVILHTNLGRAPLSSAALAHVTEAGQAYSNLEFNLERGERGKRDVHVDRLFQRLLADHSAAGPTAAEPKSASATVSTIVVNNNAAAVLLALNTLAERGEVIVSRGELVEIGGSFRIPDVMAKSNGILREVGTTNRTRIADYEAAITEKTKALLRVHRSNFEISGFTEQPSLQELVELSRRRQIPLVEDQGSGALLDLRRAGVKGESGILDSLREGVDIVLYSGDKMLGGPQAGMLSGRPDLVARMRSNSLFRALRVDKLTYAALEATLLAYVKKDYDSIPTLRMIHFSEEEIEKTTKALAMRITRPELGIAIIDGDSVIGGGAAPSAVLPTKLLAISCQGVSADEFAKQLREADVPVIARVEDNRVLLDLRTVFPEQIEALAGALGRITRR